MSVELPYLSLSRRVRATVWHEKLQEQGVKGFTVYNHMLLPTLFDNLAADYDHLAEHVQIWDVACERQVQLRGPDAFKLLDMMTPRDMAKMKELQCFYIPIVDQNGKLQNDPVALKVAEQTYWLSVASSDIILFAKGLAIGAGLDVHIEEPDINPLAIQGPKSWQLMERVFGPDIHDIKFFRFQWLTFQGVPMVVARSGFSGRGGFEIYVPGPAYAGGAHPRLATDLWDIFFAEGADLSVGPGGPNWMDFMEAGLLSFGNTVDYRHTPFEAGLGKYCDGLETCIGGAALKQQAVHGPQTMLRGLIFDQGEDVPAPLLRDWPVSDGKGRRVGYVAGVSPSIAVGRPIGIGTFDKPVWAVGTAVVVHTPTGDRTAKVADIPFR